MDFYQVSWRYALTYKILFFYWETFKAFLQFL